MSERLESPKPLSKKPVTLMKCGYCGDEIVRKMCTQKYCYKCNGEVNRIEGRLNKKLQREAKKLECLQLPPAPCPL